MKYPHYVHLLQFTTIQNDGEDLAKYLGRDQIIAVTDASVSTLTNTSAVSWTINRNLNRVLASGLSGCPSYTTPQDSYGAEMYGIYNILIVAKIVSEYHNVRGGSITLACDNDASLLIGTYKLSTVKIDKKYFDLIWAIQDVLKNVSFSVIARKVKGHANDTKTILNKFDNLNILMDKNAKCFRQNIEHGTVIHSPMHFDMIRYSTFINGDRVSCNIEDSIKQHIQGHAMKTKLIAKGDITDDAIDLVDWYTIGQTAKTLSINEKMWVAKFTSGFSPTASQMYYREVGRQNSKKRKKKRKVY